MDIKAARFSKLVRIQKLLNPDEIVKKNLEPIPELLDTEEFEIRIVQAYLQSINSMTYPILWIVFLDKNNMSILFKLQTMPQSFGPDSIEATFGFHYEDELNPNSEIEIIYSIYRDGILQPSIDIYIQGLHGRILYNEIDYKTGKIWNVDATNLLNMLFNKKYMNIRDAFDQEFLKQLAIDNHNTLKRTMLNITTKEFIPIIQKLESLLPKFESKIYNSMGTIVYDFYSLVNMI